MLLLGMRWGWAVLDDTSFLTCRVTTYHLSLFSPNVSLYWHGLINIASMRHLHMTSMSFITWYNNPRLIMCSQVSHLLLRVLTWHVQCQQYMNTVVHKNWPVWNSTVGSYFSSMFTAICMNNCAYNHGEITRKHDGWILNALCKKYTYGI